MTDSNVLPQADNRSARSDRSGPPREPEKVQTSARPDVPPDTKQENVTTARAPSKLDAMVALLKLPNGATLEDLCKATGWQSHSVRGAMASALRRKGITITSAKADGLRRYRIGDAE